MSEGRLFPTFLAYWAILAFIIYSWAGEKMPWLVLQMALPLLLMGALFLGDIFSAPRWNEARWAVLGVLLVGAMTSRGDRCQPRECRCDLKAALSDRGVSGDWRIGRIVA